MKDAECSGRIVAGRTSRSLIEIGSGLVYRDVSSRVAAGDRFARAVVR